MLLITVDSLRADRLGYAGRAGARTPRIDSLAARGRVYTRAYTPVPDGTPALASLLTGQYPASHGVHCSESESLSGDAATLAEGLASQGYRTGAFVGSVLLHPKYGLSQGFQVYRDSFEMMGRPSQLPEVGVPALTVTDHAIEFMQENRGGTYFLWVNFFDPHYFYSPPEPFASEFQDDPYQGEIAAVDREIGRLLDKLKDYGEEESTYIVLAGSNGEGLGDHGEEYHGVTLQEATTRVPLLIVAPPRLSPGRDDTPVSLVDVAPTILDLVGSPPLQGAEGMTLTAALDPDRAIHMEARLPSLLFGWAPLTAVVSGRHKLVLGTREELFDTIDDPGETRDIAASEPAVRDRLKEVAAGYAARSAPARADVRDLIEALGYGTDTAPAKRIDPRDRVAVANDALKGQRQLREGNLQAAWFLFEGVLKQDPDNYIGLLDSALLSGARGRRDEAWRLLEKARSVRPDAAEVYHQMGHFIQAVEGAGGLDRARRHWALAARLDPLNEEAMYDTACALSVEGKTREALDTLQLAVSAGFRDFKLMATDKDLDPLRSDPRFEKITEGQARKEAAATR